jgi:hypothetical protein
MAGGNLEGRENRPNLRIVDSDYIEKVLKAFRLRT